MPSRLLPTCSEPLDLPSSLSPTVTFSLKTPVPGAQKARELPVLRWEMCFTTGACVLPRTSLED